MRLLALILLASCGGVARPVITVPDEVDDPAARPALAPRLAGHRAAFRISWNGARIGDAYESLTAAGGGWRFERRERIAVRRGGTVATTRTAVRIDVDEALRAQRIVVERETGPARSRGEAVRLKDESWRVSFGDGPTRSVSGDAVPSTLVPLLVAGSGATPGRAYDGPILIEGAGLALAELALDVSPDGRRTFARIGTPSGDLRSEGVLDDRGFVASVGSPSGLASERVADITSLDAPFTPPEIVDSSTVALTGTRTSGDLHLRIRGVAARPPHLAQLAAQRVTADGAVWNVTLAAPPPPRAGELLAEIRERTHHVASLLETDLGLAPIASDEALSAGRGDCTAHALVLATLLEARGYPTKLVTGYVVVDAALRRHRWVLVQIAGDWVPVDPMLDEVPASPAHLALAVHGTSLDELAFVDDVAFAGWEAARAEVVR